MLSFNFAKTTHALSSVDFIPFAKSFTASSFKGHSWGFETHARISASVDKERRVLCGGVDMVIIHKLTKGKLGVPVVLSFIYKDSNVLFEFLVHTLCLPIRLWMICC